MARCTCPHARGGKCTKTRTPEQKARHRSVSNASYHRRRGGNLAPDAHGNSSDMERDMRELRHELQRVQSQCDAQEAKAKARIAELEAVVTASKYQSTGPEVHALQREVSRLNDELAKVRTQGHIPSNDGDQDALDLLETVRSGANIREIALTSVVRSDNGKQIDLFQKAADGYKDRSVRLSGHASTFSVNQFCYLTSPDPKNAKKTRKILIRITSVGAEEFWGDMVQRCKHELVQGEGLLNEQAPGPDVDIIDWWGLCVCVLVSSCAHTWLT